MNNPMGMMQDVQNMMNSPVMKLVNVMRNGGNVMDALQGMAGNNPMAANVFRMINGKNAQQIEQIARNACKERGVSPESIAQQLGVNLPN